MKHIFVVHSNITYLAALGVIALKELSPGDVMIVSQHYVRAHPIEVVRLKLFSKNILRPRRFFNFAHQIDRLIEKFTCGTPFELYIPAMTKPAKVVATNSLCARINFIEEGMGSYLKSYNMDSHTYEDRAEGYRANLSWAYIKHTINSIANILRGETMRLHAMPMNYTSYVGRSEHDFYCFHHSAFPLSDPDRHRLISMRAVGHNFVFEKKTQLSDQYVLIGEGLFSLSADYSTDEYIKVLELHVVPWLKENGVKELYIKHHYNESKESQDGSRAVFTRNDISINIIPNDTIMEIELQGERNVTLVGCSSSLLFYGALSGAKSFSYADKLHKPTLSIQAFREEVKQI